MQPNFKTKGGTRWYLVLKAFFFTVAALWVPICLLLAFTEEGLGRALTLLLLPLVTFPLVIAWLALFFCIRYVLILKTNDLPKTKERKTINILYLFVSTMMLVIIGCFVGSALSYFDSTSSIIMNVYMCLTIPIVGMGVAIVLMEKRITKRLNICKEIE